MKKNLLAIGMVFTLIVGANAQFNTNSIMVGASSSLDFGLFWEKDDATDEKTSITQFDLTPKVAYFLQNRIALGGELYYSSSRDKVENSDPTVYTNWRIGPFSRYYYRTVSWFVPFGEAGIGYGNDIYKSTDDITGKLLLPHQN